MGLSVAACAIAISLNMWIHAFGRMVRLSLPMRRS
jgi:hypothetical protein